MRTMRAILSTESQFGGGRLARIMFTAVKLPNIVQINTYHVLKLKLSYGHDRDQMLQTNGRQRTILCVYFNCS